MGKPYGWVAPQPQPEPERYSRRVRGLEPVQCVVEEPEVARAAEVVDDPVIVAADVVIVPAVFEEEGDVTVLLDMTLDEEVVLGEVTLDETVLVDTTVDLFEETLILDEEESDIVVFGNDILTLERLFNETVLYVTTTDEVDSGVTVFDRTVAYNVTDVMFEETVLQDMTDSEVGVLGEETEETTLDETQVQDPTPVVPGSPFMVVGDSPLVPQGWEVASPIVERVPPIPEVVFRAARWFGREVRSGVRRFFR